MKVLSPANIYFNYCRDLFSPNKQNRLNGSECRARLTLPATITHQASTPVI